MFFIYYPPYREKFIFLKNFTIGIHRLGLEDSKNNFSFKFANKAEQEISEPDVFVVAFSRPPISAAFPTSPLRELLSNPDAWFACKPKLCEGSWNKVEMAC